MTNDIYEQFIFFSSNEKVIKNTNDHLASCLKYKNALAFPLSAKNNSLSIPTIYISFVWYLLTAIAEHPTFLYEILRVKCISRNTSKQGFIIKHNLPRVFQGITPTMGE